MNRAAFALVAVFVLTSCASNRSGMTGSLASATDDAVMGLVMGVSASAVSRANGGCYAGCPPGTTCDSASGMCLDLPCQGRCGPNELCDQDGGGATGGRCVRMITPDLQIARDGEGS